MCILCIYNWVFSFAWTCCTELFWVGLIKHCVGLSVFRIQATTPLSISTCSSLPPLKGIGQIQRIRVRLSGIVRGLSDLFVLLCTLTDTPRVYWSWTSWHNDQSIFLTCGFHSQGPLVRLTWCGKDVTWLCLLAKQNMSPHHLVFVWSYETPFTYSSWSEICVSKPVWWFLAQISLQLWCVYFVYTTFGIFICMNVLYWVVLRWMNQTVCVLEGLQDSSDHSPPFNFHL